MADLLFQLYGVSPFEAMGFPIEYGGCSATTRKSLRTQGCKASPFSLGPKKIRRASPAAGRAKGGRPDKWTAALLRA